MLDSIAFAALLLVGWIWHKNHEIINKNKGKFIMDAIVIAVIIVVVGLSVTLIYG